MHTTFNSASLAKLSKSELLALLADYRARIDRAGEAEKPQIRNCISVIEQALIDAPHARPLDWIG